MNRESSRLNSFFAFLLLCIFSARYFTWDKNLFPNPSEMIGNLSAVGRKMVTIIDPHIRRDDDYYVYKQALAAGRLVRNKDGAVYEGWCWPGTLHACIYCSFYSPFCKCFIYLCRLENFHIVAVKPNSCI